ncbi:MAG: gliding motility-associated C-terminal domain-containing protein, partial [Bacteroidia bacterium]|nr:gliding motility-associated C-terminal domain-containing protein [Bacteroidia bacterium]
ISDEGYLLAIYNRWGDKIYETTDARGYWDGTIKHSKNIAPQGVYLYLITVRDYKNEPHYLTGTVTVVR